MHLGCNPWLLGCARVEGMGAQGRFVRKQIHARTAMPFPHLRTPVEANGGYSERYCGEWWAKGCIKGPDAAKTQCACKHSAPMLAPGYLLQAQDIRRPVGMHLALAPLAHTTSAHDSTGMLLTRVQASYPGKLRWFCAGRLWQAWTEGAEDTLPEEGAPAGSVSFSNTHARTHTHTHTRARTRSHSHTHAQQPTQCWPTRNPPPAPQ